MFLREASFEVWMSVLTPRQRKLFDKLLEKEDRLVPISDLLLIANLKKIRDYVCEINSLKAEIGLRTTVEPRSVEGAGGSGFGCVDMFNPRSKPKYPEFWGMSWDTPWVIGEDGLVKSLTPTESMLLNFLSTKRNSLVEDEETIRFFRNSNNTDFTKVSLYKIGESLKRKIETGSNGSVLVRNNGRLGFVPEK